jgi:hypothetical protein
VVIITTVKFDKFDHNQKKRIHRSPQQEGKKHARAVARSRLSNGVYFLLMGKKKNGKKFSRYLTTVAIYTNGELKHRQIRDCG